MNYITYADLRARVQKATGTEEEDFVKPEELLVYVNDGIREAESEILAIYEDYFLARSKITLVNGQADYTLPANIFATKIRALVYYANNSSYTINRFKELGSSKGANKFERLVYAENQSSNDRYTYQLFNNSSTEGIKLTLVPKAYENGELVHLFYIRAANKMVDDTSVCDIPEFVDFVVSYAKAQILGKEGNPNYTEVVAERDRQRKLMIDTLTNMVIDDDNEIVKDLDIYEQHN